MASNIQRLPMGRRKEIFAAVVAAQDEVQPAWKVHEALVEAQDSVAELYQVTPAAMESIIEEGLHRQWFPFDSR